MVIEPADLEWRDGLPYARRFGDIYFSVDNGLAETRYVFLDSNRLDERFRALQPGDGFTIAETGFGTGLNFLATLQLWRQRRPEGAWLHFVSVEKHPLRTEDLTRALALWPELADEAQLLLGDYPFLTPGWHRRVFDRERLTLTLVFGDATLALPELSLQADAWFLDGFAPDRNPDLWQLSLLSEISRLSKRGATLATFTCAGAVRRALGEAGFAVTRQTGYGRKREMIVARCEAPLAGIPGYVRPPAAKQRHAIVLGAGIAGVSVARALARRGWDIDLVDQADGPGAGASGNPAAIIYPKISTPDAAWRHFQQQAYLHMLAETRQLPDAWRETGLLWLLAGKQAREGDKLHDHPWNGNLVRRVEPDEATVLAGVPIADACLYFPHAGYLFPPPLYRRWLESPRIRTHWGMTVSDIRHDEAAGLWRIGGPTGADQLTAPTLIVATALGALTLSPCRDLPVYPVRGQISRFAGNPDLARLRAVLSYGGYLTPAFDGEHCLGASFLPGDDRSDVREDDHRHNLALLTEAAPELAKALPPVAAWRGRAALRAQSRDYLPFIGPATRPGGAGKTDSDFQPGLYLSVGHGSKGFCMSPLAAEILAADLCGEPYPVPLTALDSLHPGRFAARRLRKKNTGMTE